MGKAIQVTDSNFEELVLNSDKPVVVDFWAKWCGPCLMMAPAIDELAADMDGKAVVAKLDVDENPQISAKFGIRSIPTLLYFQNGEVVDKAVGALPKAALEQKFQPMLSN